MPPLFPLFCFQEMRWIQDNLKEMAEEEEEEDNIAGKANY